MKRPVEYHPPITRTPKAALFHDEREWAHKTNMLRRQKRVPVTLATIGGVDYSRLDGKPAADVDTPSPIVRR